MLRNFNMLATKICPVILGIDAAGATPFSVIQAEVDSVYFNVYLMIRF